MGTPKYNGKITVVDETKITTDSLRYSRFLDSNLADLTIHQGETMSMNNADQTFNDDWVRAAYVDNTGRSYGGRRWTNRHGYYEVEYDDPVPTQDEPPLNSTEVARNWGNPRRTTQSELHRLGQQREAALKDRQFVRKRKSARRK